MCPDFVLILDQHQANSIHADHASQCCTYIWNYVSECKLVAFVSIVYVQWKIRLFNKTIIIVNKVQNSPLVCEAILMQQFSE